MASLNKVIIIGHVGSIKSAKTGSGNMVTNISVATNEDYGPKERTEWHKIVVFGKSAEACATYLKKGSQLCVEGRLQTKEWKDKSGNVRYATEIVSNRTIFLGSPGHSPVSAEDMPITMQLGEEEGF